ncbi:hypothetical protein pb186bvf_018070 [Paramecium bursaria]
MIRLIISQIRFNLIKTYKQQIQNIVNFQRQIQKWKIISLGLNYIKQQSKSRKNIFQEKPIYKGYTLDALQQYYNMFQ